MRGEASLQYTSPLQMEAKASLSSSMKNLEALKMVVRNNDDGRNYRSHVEMGWAPTQEIVLDGSFRSEESWYETQRFGDLTISTPFDQLKTATVHAEQSVGNDKHSLKTEIDLNDQSIFEVDMAYNKDTNHVATITMEKPYAMQLSASGSMDPILEGEVFVNWDRNEPESNIRLKGKYENRDASSTTDKEWMLRLIHPSRTMGIENAFFKSSTQTKSSGKLITDERDGHMVFYQMELNDRSRRSVKLHEGQFKIGHPLRSLQVTGSFGDTGRSTTMDGSFFWDADNDQSKQVGIKTVVQPGSETNKADITLTLPSISREFKLGSEMKTRQGRTLFDGKTEFSYSPDTRKTLVLTSKLEDISYGYRNSNYSLSLGIAHPYTDIDVQFKSHMGTDQDRMSAGMDIRYLTASRQRKNLALLGEIDLLKKKMNFMMDTPLKRMEMTGALESETPYILSLSSQMDGGEPLKTDVTLDLDKKKFGLTTGYEFDNPDTLVLTAAYINETFIQMEAHREQLYLPPTRDVQLTFSLQTPHLIQSRLHWRPNIIQDVQTFATRKLQDQGSRLVSTIDTLSESLKQELSGKYKAIVDTFAEDVQPLIDLLDGEMNAIDRELDIVRRDLRRMYLRNAFYLKDLGDNVEAFYRSTFESYKEFAAAYKQFHADVKQKISEFTKKIQNLQAGSLYQESVDSVQKELKNVVISAVYSLSDLVAGIDDKISALHKRMSQVYQTAQDKWTELKTSIQTHPTIVRVRNSVPNVEEYIDMAHEKLRSQWQTMSLPERYTSVIYEARDLINSGLQQALESEDIQRLRDVSNEIYQQGVWAYNYWQLEENLKEHLKNIFRTLEDMISEEINRHRQKLDFLHKWQVTVYDPKHGDIQVAIYSPIPLDSLDSLPDISPYTTEMTNMVESAQSIYDNYFPKSFFQVTNKTTADDDFDAQFKDYMDLPKRSRRIRQQKKM